jgi:hypothetical protein
MSALSPRADIRRHDTNVRSVPRTDLCTAHWTGSLGRHYKGEPMRKNCAPTLNLVCRSTGLLFATALVLLTFAPAALAQTSTGPSQSATAGPSQAPTAGPSQLPNVGPSPTPQDDWRRGMAHAPLPNTRAALLPLIRALNGRGFHAKPPHHTLNRRRVGQRSTLRGAVAAMFQPRCRVTYPKR